MVYLFIGMFVLAVIMSILVPGVTDGEMHIARRKRKAFELLEKWENGEV